MSGEHTSAMSERDQDADRPLLERIDAEITALAADSRFEVRNPASGTVIAQVPDQGAAETQDAIARAKAAFPSWAAKTAKERGQVLQRWHALIVANQRALAVLLTREQGKPLAEAMGEILFGATFIEWFAEEAKRIYGDVIPTNSPTRRLLVLKQPIGVVGAITPWNFPSAMVTRKVAPALAAGCTIVLKPAEDTPLSALALQLLAKDAGFPDGVFQVITSARAEPVANVLPPVLTSEKSLSLAPPGLASS
jgi:succinate-semialdehyde dehydrogenase/glutarate-semialdehyde dehydrogenase